MSQQPESVRRLPDPDFRLAEIAMQRAAEKAQRRIREAGFEPVVRMPTPTTPTGKHALPS